MRKRNQPCHCGSGKPYKKCHRDLDQAASTAESSRGKRSVEDQSCTARVNQAQRLKDQNRIDEAFALALEVLRGGHACISWEAAGHIVTDVLLERGDVKAAASLAQDLVTVNPRCPLGWFQLGSMHEANGSWNDAAAAFVRAIEMADTRTPSGTATAAHLHLARAAVRADRLDLIETHLDRWEASEPSDHDGRLFWAMCLIEADRLDKAERILQALRDAESADQKAPVIHELGMVALDRGHLDKAYELFQESARVGGSGAHQSHTMLAIVERERGHSHEAVKWARRALTAQPHDLTYQVNLAGALVTNGQLTEALGEYRTVVDHVPGFHEVRYSYAFALFRADRLDDAIAEMRHLEGTGWSFPSLAPNLGVVLLHRDRPGDAEEALARHRRALQLDWPPLHEACLVLNTVRIIARIGNQTEAIELASREYPLWPTDAQAELAETLSRLRSGERERVVNDVVRLFGEEALANLLSGGTHSPVGAATSSPHSSSMEQTPAADRAMERIAAGASKLSEGVSPLDKSPAPEPSPAPPAASTGAADTDEIDVAIITVLDEEYKAVRRRLVNPTFAPGTQTCPNLYAWEIGSVPRSNGGGSYRVVLAMAGRPGNVSGSQATMQTVLRWGPRYVLVVGIAGGLGLDGAGRGDVVISKTIYGYEYGKQASSFEPRHDFVYQVDGPLLKSALRIKAIGEKWQTDLPTPPEPKEPNLYDGTVASGEKVIDDRGAELFAKVRASWPKLAAVEMEGAGAAAAIDAIRDMGRVVGFLMVRGISDMPPEAPAATDPAKSQEGGRPAVVDGAAQSAERDRWKVFAAESAAAFALHWIANGWPVPPRR